MSSLEASDQLAQESQDRHGGRRRVSLADMQTKIKNVYCFTAGSALSTMGMEGTGPDIQPGDHADLRVLTICIITVENGFTITGTSAPADPNNFDKKLGEQFAYEDALRQLWPLEGYLLREELHNEGDGVVDAEILPEMMYEVGVEGDRFNPHERNDDCATAGCVRVD